MAIRLDGQYVKLTGYARSPQMRLLSTGEWLTTGVLWPTALVADNAPGIGFTAASPDGAVRFTLGYDGVTPGQSAL
jgi:hypothetical protein